VTELQVDDDRQKELERLGSRDGQAAEFKDALMQGLNALNLELAAHGVQPRIDAVVQALTMLQAEFVAMDPVRNSRRATLKTIERNLGAL
jgi:hypothetical protein